MKSKNEKVRLEKEINGSNRNAAKKSSSRAIATHTSSVDGFYTKLCKLYESSGLSLLFNFRETSLDLYMFYKEVTERGGYNLVTKDGSWGEIASILNSKSIVSMSPTQLQKLYANLLYQFEQMYHYRTPAKLASASGHPSGIEDNISCSTGKRKHCDSSQLSIVHCDTKDGPTAKRKWNKNSNQLSTAPKSKEKKPNAETSPKYKDIKKDPNAPLRSKSAYQIFLKKECDRLKNIHGENSGSLNLRTMAIDAWRCLSESDRQPYVEESWKDKERFNREMTAYRECKNVLDKEGHNMPCNSKPIVGNSNMLWQTDDGDYHVNLQPASENFFVPDDSTVEFAFSLIKNARPDDTIFQVNLDEYCGSLDIPN